MKTGTKWFFLTVVLVLILTAVLSVTNNPSFGQRRFPPPNRKPACTIFCGGSTPGYIHMFPPKSEKCWGGPLPADQADNVFNEMSEEDKNLVCQTLKTSGKTDAACPALKEIREACRQREDPEDKKCEKSDSPWFGTPSTDCKDFQGWQVEQKGGTVTVYICGHGVFNNPTIGTDPIYAKAYVGNLKEYLSSTIGEKLCCDTFREAAQTGVPCDPRKDVDCDGKPNAQDILSEGGGLPDINLNYATTAGASIDPFPPGMHIGEIYPNQFSCKDCQWELMRGELKCSPDGVQKHVYQAKWRCPSTGVEADTFKYAPATSPCKK